jgi:Tfp pilus assembly protein PilN
VAATQLGSSTTTAVAPKVNLLPPEIAEKARLRKAQLAMAGTGLAAVAVVGLLYTQQTAKVSEARAAKDEAVATNVDLQTELHKLDNVQQTRVKVDAAKATLASAMAQEVTWSTYLHDMTLTIPEEVWLTSFNAQVNPPVTTPGATAPVLDPGIGVVTINGVAFSHDDVAAWLESLAKEKGYANPYFTQAVEGEINKRTVVNFTSTVNLTPAALSGRYTNPKGLER